MEYIANKSILITGGTVSLGKALTENILKNHPEVKKLIIYSRDEQKQFQMKLEFLPHIFMQIFDSLSEILEIESF